MFGGSHALVHLHRFEGMTQPGEGRGAIDDVRAAHGCFIAAWDGGSDASFPGGNQVDGLPPAPSF